MDSLNMILERLFNEQELKKRAEEEIKKIAKNSSDGYNFLDKLVTDFGFNIKDGDLKNVGIVDLETAKKYWKRVTNNGKDLDMSKWKQYPDKIEDVRVSYDSYPYIERVELDNSISGEARSVNNVIKVSNKLFRYNDENIKEILYHEVGHVMVRFSSSLADWIQRNPEAALGRYNKVKGRWRGISYNPEESWAQGFAMYILRPHHLKGLEVAERAYEFVDKVCYQLDYKHLLEDVWDNFKKLDVRLK